MANVYLDTSALLKLYIEEDGADRVTHIVEDAEDGRVFILDLTKVEARSATRRRERGGDITGPDAERILRQIEDDASALFLVQPSTSAVMEEAARLIDRHPLRAYDALQLAGCLVVCEGLGEPVTFVCADARLCEAAANEGLPTLNPVAQ
jgi:predicted nucleic acid-binding protein